MRTPRTPLFPVCCVALLSVSMWLVPGCGGDGGSSDGVDAAMGTDGGVDADQTAPMLVSSNIADGATRVSVWTNITATVSEALAPNSVTAMTVTVGRPDQYATVEYENADRTITVDPLRAFDYGNVYTLKLSGITDTVGNTMPDATITFATYLNRDVRTVSFTNGATVRVVLNTVDAMGRETRYVEYNDPGTDATWETADDVPTYYREKTYVAGGLLRDIRYTGPGVDATWFTADDVQGISFERSYDAQNRLVRQQQITGPGTDDVWFTADDERSIVFGYAYGSEGDLAVTTTYVAAGDDGVWLTADDVQGGYTSYDYDAAGRTTQVVNGQGAGPDMTWMTADDVLQNYSRSTYDDDGMPTRSVTWSSAGDDGIWMTADDVVVQYTDYETDSVANTVTETGYSGSASRGPDMMWLTADDVPASRTVRHFEEHGSLTRLVSWGPGLDGTWDTADDTPISYGTYDLDDKGNRTTSQTYSGPGTDDTWFTADDVIRTDRDFDTAN